MPHASMSFYTLAQPLVEAFGNTPSGELLELSWTHPPSLDGGALPRCSLSVTFWTLPTGAGGGGARAARRIQKGGWLSRASHDTSAATQRTDGRSDDGRTDDAPRRTGGRCCRPVLMKLIKKRVVQRPWLESQALEIQRGFPCSRPKGHRPC